MTRQGRGIQSQGSWIQGGLGTLWPRCPHPQFHKDMKEAQELLRKVDSDLNQKYSPDFKDRYQIELLLRELDVSVVVGGGGWGTWP